MSLKRSKNKTNSSITVKYAYNQVKDKTISELKIQPTLFSSDIKIFKHDRYNKVREGQFDILAE